MSLSIGIVGLPNVGKSTLFNALLKKQQALAANYPFATIEPNVGIVPVPDPRLQKLAEVIAANQLRETPGESLSGEAYTRSGKEGQAIEITKLTKLPPMVPATVTFVDIAGIVKGASEGEGLGNKFLAQIREAQAICMVVRAFNDSDVVATSEGDPASDKEVLLTELALADLQTVAKQVEPKGKITPEQKIKWEVIEKIHRVLDKGDIKELMGLVEEERESVRDLCLLTLKPVIYVVNVGEEKLQEPNNKIQTEYATSLKVKPEEVVVISAKVEAELAALSEPEQLEYLASMGFGESGLERLIRASYDILKLQSFLTAGEIECRAWTIRCGETALGASAVIHTDFAKKFIKADVIDWQEFVRLGGWKKAREEGAVRSEGRDYVMRDGEVVEFKIGT